MTLWRRKNSVPVVAEVNLTEAGRVRLSVLKSTRDLFMS